MSSWVDALSDPRPIRAIFGDVVPSPRGLVVHEVTVKRDGPVLYLSFELPEFPADPPRKWVAARANRVHVRIAAFGVSDLSIAGVSPEMVADLALDIRGSRVAVHLLGPSVQVRAWADTVRVDRISAYTHSEMP